FERIRQSGQHYYIKDLSIYFKYIPRGYWPESPREAVIVPLRASDGTVWGFLVCGLNARRRFDADYSLFIESIGNAIATSHNTNHALEEERKRAQALQEIDRAKTAFFSNISHEFRTPLTLMLGPLEEVLDRGDDVPEKVRSNIEISYRNTLRL